MTVFLESLSNLVAWQMQSARQGMIVGELQHVAL